MATKSVRIPVKGSISIEFNASNYKAITCNASIYAFGMGFAEMVASGVKGGEQTDRRN
jgi:hypothetical protein